MEINTSCTDIYHIVIELNEWEYADLRGILASTLDDDDYTANFPNGTVLARRLYEGL